MENLKWVTNEPKDYRPLPQYQSDGTVRVSMTYDEWLQWRSQFVVGRPKQPDGSDITVADLENEGYIGLYRLVSV